MVLGIVRTPWNPTATSFRPRAPNDRSNRTCRKRVAYRAAHASATNGFYNVDKVEQLKKLLSAPGIQQGPCAHDALSAKLIERGGFSMAFMSGFCVSGARLAEPDAGMISYGEMVDAGKLICDSTSIPIIGDGDTGYGNAMNVKRTVQGYARAGFAGILIEDQVAPKACGHTRNRKVVSRGEALSRVRAAADARDEGAGILIAARTDSRSACSLEEALWRVQAFRDEGADVVFIDALQSREEMEAFCKAAPFIPKMANMLEGGGSTPLLSPRELEEMGFKLVAYPLSLLGVSMRAMETALDDLKRGVVPTSPALPTFPEMQEVLGFPEYYAEEARYAVRTEDAVAADVVSGDLLATSTQSIEPELLEPEGYGGAQSRGSSLRRGLWLRLTVTNSDGVVQLDTRFPADFLGGLAGRAGTFTNFLPQVAGLDLDALLKDVPLSNVDWDSNKPQELIDVMRGGQRIQVSIDQGSGWRF
ncbi:hypothetical protein CYMTET_51015 [Cymbomonas tetramitiformis]|uniref:Isocitrate lyase n=1 Tax=Cymbomonas tetramitiformis TaxID=36881 RepID=A0AAE0BN36_9CHLO|nr:hypothetical protein CYMTET_51015 [Cymbomonas tetramitiformis]